MRIKVYGGTKEERHLCQSCQWSHLIEGQSSGQTINLCRRDIDDAIPPIPITFRVAECNQYQERSDRNLMDRYEQHATYLIKLPSGRFAGVTTGQASDYEFMRAIRKLDREKHKVVEDTAETKLKEAEEREKKYAKAGK